MTSSKRLAILAAATSIGAVTAYTLIIRRWHNRWGVTDSEVSMKLPGDEIVKNPNFLSTRAITIYSDPEDIWPWLVQMGKHRGGLYSYDWLDIAFKVLDRPSTESILPQFQQLKAGDTIPIGNDNTEMDDFYVHLADPEHALVIGANDPAFRNLVSWAMVLIPERKGKTRLLVRVRGDMKLDWRGIPSYAALEPAAFVMVRKQMLNFKRLAERTYRERTEGR